MLRRLSNPLGASSKPFFSTKTQHRSSHATPAAHPIADARTGKKKVHPNAGHHRTSRLALASTGCVGLLSAAVALRSRHLESSTACSFASMAPSVTHDSATEGGKHGNFDLVRRVELEYAPGMSIEKWQSRKTGFTLYWADFESKYTDE